VSDAAAAEAGLPRAYLRTVLLVLVAEGPTHGYELLEAARALGMRLNDPGGLYRTLRTLEHEELLASWWEDSSTGPPRRTYELTAAGRAALAETLETIRGRVALLSNLLEHARSHDLIDR